MTVTTATQGTVYNPNVKASDGEQGTQFNLKTSILGLSCGIICVILRLAVFTQYQSVTDTHTDRQTDGQIHDDGMYRA